jgi:chromate reductase
LKNALDQGSRPTGHNAWGGKPGGVMGVSPGPISTATAQQHLRNILVTLDVAVMAQPELFIQFKEGLFDEAGNIGPASKAFLQKWMDRYVAWVKRLTS